MILFADNGDDGNPNTDKPDGGIPKPLDIEEEDKDPKPTEAGDDNPG